MLRTIFCLAATISLLLTSLPASALAAEDWSVPNGHFFTQTGGGGGRGYTVTDDDGVLFWREFKRLGGVAAVGYPVSRRFDWEGFTVQAFQRVVFQWRPECECVYFVNVFDRLHELGKDGWLFSVRQTPRPKDWDDQGEPWTRIVNRRLAVMDAFPAIRTAYFSVVGDAIQMNGLPTTDVIDMGNHYALRTQRVVFQLWKDDVPWAKKGEVTVALGGDIAKEAGILPSPIALQPVAGSATTSSSASGCVSRIETNVSSSNGSGTQTLRITALDASGRGVQGANITAVLQDATGTHRLEIPPTGADGVTAASWSFGASGGPRTVTVSVSGGGCSSTSTVTVG